MVCTDWTNDNKKKNVSRKCCWLCDIFYFFSNQYFQHCLEFYFFCYLDFFSILSTLLWSL